MEGHPYASSSNVQQETIKEVLDFLRTANYDFDNSGRDKEVSKLKIENRKLGVKKRNLKRVIKNKTKELQQVIRIKENKQKILSLETTASPSSSQEIMDLK